MVNDLFEAVCYVKINKISANKTNKADEIKEQRKEAKLAMRKGFSRHRTVEQKHDQEFEDSQNQKLVTRIGLLGRGSSEKMA